MPEISVLKVAVPLDLMLVATVLVVGSPTDGPTLTTDHR
jgi:hypothetical protein